MNSDKTVRVEEKKKEKLFRRQYIQAQVWRERLVLQYTDYDFRRESTKKGHRRTAASQRGNAALPD